MSDQRKFTWKSGAITSAPIQEFWKPRRTLSDPSIPNLPLETASVAGVALDDGSGDGWWAGAQQCFVGVAIAGAVAALSLSTAIAGSFKHNDEILPAAASVAHTHSAIGTQRAQHATAFVRFTQSDELPAVAFTPADDGGWEPPQLAASPLPLFQPWDSNEQLPAIRLEDETWVQPAPIVQAVTASLTLWAGDELAPPAVVSEDYWQRFDVVAGVPVLALWQQDDDLPAQAAPVLDEYEWREQRYAEYRAAQQQETHHDELAAPVIEEYWFRTESAIVPALLSIWTNEDDLPAAVTVAVDIEQFALDMRAVDKIDATVWTDTDYFAPTPPDPAGAVTTSSVGNQRATSTTSIVRLQQQDELPVVVAFNVDEDQPWNFDQRSGDVFTYVVWAENEEVVPAATPAISEYEWAFSFTTAIVQAKSYIPVVVDEAFFPAPIIDEDQAWDFNRLSLDSFTYVVWAENEDIVPTPLVEEQYFLDLRSYPAAIVALVWSDAGNEYPTPVAPMEFTPYEWHVYTPLPLLPLALYLPDADDVPAGFLVEPPAGNNSEWIVIARRRFRR